MNSEHKHSTSDNPIIVKEFLDDKHALLYDSEVAAEIMVDIINGMSFCGHCNSDDWGHVGFTIYLDQLYDPGKTIESIDAEK